MLVFTRNWCIYFSLIPLSGPAGAVRWRANLWTACLTDCVLTNMGLKPGTPPFCHLGMKTGWWVKKDLQVTLSSAIKYFWKSNWLNLRSTCAYIYGLHSKFVTLLTCLLLSLSLWIHHSSFDHFWITIGLMFRCKLNSWLYCQCHLCFSV